jgi:23S rRNA pseudoU1915 N3-methylase RlmH
MPGWAGMSIPPDLVDYTSLESSHVPDKYAYDAGKIAEYQAGTYKVVLDIEAKEFSSQDLAKKLVDLEMSVKRNKLFDWRARWFARRN